MNIYFFLVIGKELIACETARESFLSILNVVGGPNEKIRADKLLKSITFLRDVNEIEENSLWSGNVKLRLGKKIQQRTYKVFTFGMYHKAITVTANKAAAEAAKMQVKSLKIHFEFVRFLMKLFVNF